MSLSHEFPTSSPTSSQVGADGAVLFLTITLLTTSLWIFMAAMERECRWIHLSPAECAAAVLLFIYLSRRVVTLISDIFGMIAEKRGAVLVATQVSLTKALAEERTAKASAHEFKAHG